MIKVYTIVSGVTYTSTEEKARIYRNDVPRMHLAHPPRTYHSQPHPHRHGNYRDFQQGKLGQTLLGYWIYCISILCSRIIEIALTITVSCLCYSF